MVDTAAVFLHGIFSSAATWGDMRKLLNDDSEVADNIDFYDFEYPSPRVSLGLAGRVPNFDLLADRLDSFLDVTLRRYSRIALVAHSQGGLIALRMLARQLADGHGAKLARIRRVVLFACPNNGSELLLTVRKRAFFLMGGHAQEEELRPLMDSVMEAQRRVLRDVVYASGCGGGSCSIPIVAYVGESDSVVRPASARSVFPDARVLPGGHSSIIRPSTAADLAYATLKDDLQRCREEPFPSGPGVAGRPPLVASHYHTELLSNGPMEIVFASGAKPTLIYVHSGPIDQVANVDIIATSQNSYMQMAMTFKPSVSGRIRYAAATKGPTGEIIADTVFDELNSWLKRHGRYGLPVEPGTVAATSSGELLQRGVKRIYHAAIGSPIHGTDQFDVNPQTVARAVHNTFRLARIERDELGIQLNSVCFPLFGSGLAGLDPAVCFEWMWGALRRELSDESGWSVHISTWSKSETSVVMSMIGRHSERMLGRPDSL